VGVCEWNGDDWAWLWSVCGLRRDELETRADDRHLAEVCLDLAGELLAARESERAKLWQ
jgi:hypothetical protein